MRVIDRETAEHRLDLDNVPHAYRSFQQAEEISVHRGLAVDWPTLETEPWERTGERGAFVNLCGAEGVTDIQLHDLSPGGTTDTLRHLHDQLVYVSEGSGLTVVGEGDDAVSFEWGPDALFWIPPNTPYRHVNASGGEPARSLADTPLPQLFNTFPTVTCCSPATSRCTASRSPAWRTRAPSTRPGRRTTSSTWTRTPTSGRISRTN